MRRPGAEIPDEALLPVRFRPKFENLLFPEQIHGQAARDNERNLAGLVAVGVLGIVLKDESVASFVKLDQLTAQGWVGGRVAVLEVIDLSLGEWILLKKLYDTEGFAADGQYIHRMVVMALRDFNDLRCTAHPSNSFRERQENPELRFFLQTTVHHFEITRLEDVQGKVRAGEKNDV